MAFKQAGQIFDRKIPKIVKTYDELVEKWMYHKGKGIDLMFDDDEGLLEQGRGRFANLNGLCHPGEVLQYRRTKGKYKVARREAADRRDPVTIIQPPWAWLQAQEKADVIHDDLAFDMFQENMRLLLENGRGIAGVESFRGPGRACEPLLMLWKEALDEPEKPLSAKLVFGLEMVLSTFKSFLWPDVMTNKTNCRIAALKFAQDVKSNLAQTLDILQKDAGPEKSRTRQEHEDRLISMIAKMDMFCREKRFDLYYQAPWIARCHMLEFHTLAMHDGVYVCSVSGHVCATLHMYNALRQVGNKTIKSIPILDFLCEIFKDRLFFSASEEEVQHVLPESPRMWHPEKQRPRGLVCLWTGAAVHQRRLPQKPHGHGDHFPVPHRAHVGLYTQALEFLERDLWRSRQESFREGGETA